MSAPDTATLLDPLKLSTHFTLGVCTHTMVAIPGFVQLQCSNCGSLGSNLEPRAATAAADHPVHALA